MSLFKIIGVVVVSDPQEWSRDQVHAWLQYTVKQFKITLTQDIQNIFDEDGKQLSRLNEMDFVNRIPQVRTSNTWFLFIHLGVRNLNICQKTTNFKNNRTNLVYLNLVLLSFLINSQIFCNL